MADGNQGQLALSEPSKWTRPKGRKVCGRDPEAGPGSCKLWWEGCPKGEQRGCYLVWFRSQQQVGRP